jgi:hypothetical protein
LVFSILLRSRHHYIFHTWGLIVRWMTSKSCEYCGISDIFQLDRPANGRYSANPTPNRS